VFSSPVLRRIKNNHKKRTKDRITGLKKQGINWIEGETLETYKPELTKYKDFSWISKEIDLISNKLRTALTRSSLATVDTLFWPRSGLLRGIYKEFDENFT
jgi:hypothetical protein